jgi:hypothetical protein
VSACRREIPKQEEKVSPAPSAQKLRIHSSLKALRAFLVLVRFLIAFDVVKCFYFVHPPLFFPDGTSFSFFFFSLCIALLQNNDSFSSLPFFHQTRYFPRYFSHPSRLFFSLPFRGLVLFLPLTLAPKKIQKTLHSLPLRCEKLLLSQHIITS